VELILDINHYIKENENLKKRNFELQEEIFKMQSLVGKIPTPDKQFNSRSEVKKYVSLVKI
jgi:hypothetical protein